MLKKIVLALTVALATASVHGEHADSETTSIFYGRSFCLLSSAGLASSSENAPLSVKCFSF